MGRGGCEPPSKEVDWSRHAGLNVNFKQKKRQISMDEVSSHNKENDAWVVVEGRVLDVTSWVARHPGGQRVLVGMAGKDATDTFHAFHHPTLGRAHKMLRSFHIGDLRNEDVVSNPVMQSFRELRAGIIADGLMEPNAWISLFRFLGGCLPFLAIALVTMFGQSSYALKVVVAAPSLGIFWQQLAFLGHDLGHTLATHVQRIDYLIGASVGNLLFGVSSGWWRDSHFTHHTFTNSVDWDPDIQHPPIFAVTERLYSYVPAKSGSPGPVFSKYFGWNLDFGPIGTKIITFQHYLFYPIMAVARFNLFAQGIIFVATKRSNYRALEACTLFGFFVLLYLLLTTGVGGTIGQQVFFLVVACAVSGVLHVQICISHFSMDTYEGVQYGLPGKSWIETQLETTMDVECPRWLDWFHGGLQFQVEHHCFPRVPRHHLREIKRRLMAWCLKEGLAYHSETFVEANKSLVAHLKSQAESAARFGNINFTDSFLWEGMCAQG